MIRFDAYTATSSALSRDNALSVLCSSGLNDISVRESRGFHQFGHRLAVSDSCGEFGSVQWGGRHGDLVLLEVKGANTPRVVQALRERFEHRCTRVDSCADFDAPRAFERLYRACRQVKRAHRIVGGKQGDWEDFPERGRTLYLGASSSAVRTRLYEKGRQPEYVHLGRPDWVRLEIQVRPVKQAKHVYSRLSPEEVWGASRWTRDLAAAVLKQHVDPHPAGTVYRRTEDDAALDWMCRQYGARLLSVAHDLGGWDALGLTLGEIVKSQRGGG